MRHDNGGKGYSGAMSRRLASIAAATSLVLWLGVAVLARIGSSTPSSPVWISRLNNVHSGWSLQPEGVWYLQRDPRPGFWRAQKPGFGLRTNNYGLIAVQHVTEEFTIDFESIPTMTDVVIIHTRVVAIPYTPPLWCLAALPVAWVVRRVLYGRRLRKPFARLGLCPVCSYDLRASADRCPECGTPIVRLNE
jgi:hypothetical protein